MHDGAGIQQDSGPESRAMCLAGTTYDVITRATACSAADAAASHRGGCAFVFISAAEAGWPEDTPLLPPFLKDYLTAKRAVETHLQDLAESGAAILALTWQAHPHCELIRQHAARQRVQVVQAA